MDKDIKSLVIQYLKICNTMMEDQIITPNMEKSLVLANTIHKHHYINLTVYCGDPDSHVKHFLIRFRENRFEFVSDGKDVSAIKWEIRLKDIEDVVRKSNEYKNNPDKLGWNCLFSRLGFKFGDTTKL